MRNIRAPLNLTDRLADTLPQAVTAVVTARVPTATYCSFPNHMAQQRHSCAHASSLIWRSLRVRGCALPREAVETCSCDVKKRHLVGSRWLAWGAVRVFRESPRGLSLYSESMKIKAQRKMKSQTSSPGFVRRSYWWAGVKVQQPPIETLKLNSLPIVHLQKRGGMRERSFLLDLTRTESRGINYA